MVSGEERRFSLIYPHDMQVDGEPVIRWHTTLIQWASHVSKNLGHRDRVVLAPELPYSVVPRRVRDRWNLPFSPLPASEWINGQVPGWEGVPCDGGYISIWVDSFRRIHGLEDSRYWQKINLLALFPHYDPNPAPLEAMLGSDFFLSNRLRLTFSYGLIRPRDRGELTVRENDKIELRYVRDHDPNIPCGHLVYPRSLPES